LLWKHRWKRRGQRLDGQRPGLAAAQRSAAAPQRSAAAPQRWLLRSQNSTAIPPRRAGPIRRSTAGADPALWVSPLGRGSVPDPQAHTELALRRRVSGIASARLLGISLTAARANSQRRPSAKHPRSPKLYSTVVAFAL
jgi:hypothetical protein